MQLVHMPEVVTWLNFRIIIFTEKQLIISRIQEGYVSIDSESSPGHIIVKLQTKLAYRSY